MTRINLLPWREERREQRKREFFGMLVLAFIVGAVIALLWIFWMHARINNQDSRNAYLEAQIRQQDAKIAQIKDLRKTRDRLLARKKIIEKLQANRSQMVHLFDELVKATPDSVQLTNLSQTGQNLTLEGVAQSNAAVAAFMRKIDASPWLGSVNLKKTEKHDGGPNPMMPYQFTVGTKLSKPEDKDEDKDEGDGHGAAAAAAGGAS